MNEATDSPADSQMSSKWWIPIGILVAISPILALVSFLLPPDAYALILTGPVVLVGVLLMILSPVFVYYDSRYLTTTSRWEPSGLYYLMFLPLIGYVLSVMYIYNRRKHLGIP